MDPPWVVFGISTRCGPAPILESYLHPRTSCIMSMGNFIPAATESRLVMAATNSSARTSAPADDAAKSGVGMAHLTVVPTNFEPPESDDREE